MAFRNLLAGCALALAATAASAAPPADLPPGGPMPSPMMEPGREPIPPFLHGVSLSEDQRDKLFEIMHAQIPALRAREKELRQAHEGLLKLSLNSEFDDVKAKSLADAIARATADIALSRARNDAKIYRLLTPEQRKQVGSVPRPQERAAQAGEPCGEPPRR
jgi:periplasmic protein CpxP/Spy